MERHMEDSWQQGKTRSSVWMCGYKRPTRCQELVSGAQLHLWLQCRLRPELEIHTWDSANGCHVTKSDHERGVSRNEHQGNRPKDLLVKRLERKESFRAWNLEGR